MEKNSKIKVAIATRQMEMGGIEKSLIELCRVLVAREIEVTLYLEASGGELYDKLPPQVKVAPIFKSDLKLIKVFLSALKRKNFKAASAAVRLASLSLTKGDPVRMWEATVRYLDAIPHRYDYAFAYGAPISFSVLFVDRMLRAKKKYAWIHNEPDRISLDIQKHRTLFEPFDKVVCVSQKAMETFVSLLPEYRAKTTVFYNIIDRDGILRQAQADSYYDGFAGTKLLTVGRICQQKGQDLIPAITKQLVSNGYPVRWYCVGEGESRSELERLIEEAGVNAEVVLLGNQNNPYPFFKMADIYVQPSRHEGFGITLTEAKAFHLPIVATNFSGANEQIVNGETGLIVHFDAEEIYRAIVKLLEDRQLAERFRENLKADPKSCISKLEELIQ